MHHRLAICLFLMFVCPTPPRALEPVRVADTVYAFIGDSGDIGPANGGNVGNSGFIVGRTGVIVVDTGISYHHGKAMIEAIRKVSPLPVELAIITHAVQEFLFGNAAFVEIHAPLLTHVESAELMRQRCDHCLSNLRKILGDEAMSGTRLVVPERTVKESTVLDVAGRKLDVLFYGWASTPGDLAVFDRDSGVLFAGGLVASHRIPGLRDGKLEGWLQALDRLEQVAARAIVPGHGAVGGKLEIQETAAYLRALDAKVRTLYKDGASLMQAVDSADLPAYAGWSMYPTLHRQNVLHRYLQLEVDELGGN
jgi:glyoxylase-like metal-dependent hydrolase (beta-lactamase superfamily II)